jgi:PAS domain S-box-containing protein
VIQKGHNNELIPLRISLTYAVMGGLWILFSDLLLSLILKDPVLISRIQTFKGWAFIALTSFLLYALIRRGILSLKRAEHSLRQSEEVFETLVQNTTSAIFIYRDKIIVANKAMQFLSGFTHEELLSMEFADCVHPDFRKKMIEKCEAFHRGMPIPLRCELKITRKDGEERWIDFSSAVISYQGLPSGLGTAFDITAQKAAMKALQESEEKFRLMVEGIIDYEIFMLDTQGRIMSWNVGAEKSKGYKPEEIIGKHHSIFFTEEGIRRGDPQFEIATAVEQGRFEDEGWRVRKDGSLFWANVVTTAVHTTDGFLRGFVKVIRDVTDRKKADETLRESEERYRVIAQTATDAIVTIDGNSTVFFANAAVEQIFGYKPEELINSRIWILMPERFRKRHLESMEKYLQTGKKSVSWKALEVTGLRKDGKEIPLEISYGEFTRQNSQFFSGVIRDISERKQAEKERDYQNMLERFNLELESLVAERTMNLLALKLADEVRTPAAVIGGMSKRILEQEELKAKVKEGISTVIEEARKLEVIVRDFQSLLKGKKRAFSYEDINEIVKEVLSIIRSEASLKNVTVRVDLAERPLKINVQKDLMRMAVFNMLRNALESTSEGGLISVSTLAFEDKVTLTVSDNGHGIPEEILDKIFDPFYSMQVYNFGMGLPLIKQIVSEHLGEIEIQSESGHGTTLRISFPSRWLYKSGIPAT